MSLRPFAQKRETVTATVLMAQQQTFVLVEGQAEVIVLKPHVGERAQVRDLVGRSNVQEAWKILDKAGACNFVALVDADFDEVVGRNGDAPRLLYVARSNPARESVIDLEAMLLRSRAIQEVCEHFLGEQLCWLGGPVRFADEMRESLRKAAASVGSFRAAVMSIFAEGRPVQPIGDVTPDEWSEMLDTATGLVDHGRLEQFVGNRIMNIARFAEVKRRAADYRLSDGEGWLLCRGHDMTQMLAMRLGHFAGRPITRRDVEDVLYCSDCGTIFQETTFGTALQNFLRPRGKVGRIGEP